QHGERFGPGRTRERSAECQCRRPVPFVCDAAAPRAGLLEGADHRWHCGARLHALRIPVGLPSPTRAIRSGPERDAVTVHEDVGQRWLGPRCCPRFQLDPPDFFASYSARQSRGGPGRDLRCGSVRLTFRMSKSGSRLTALSHIPAVRSPTALTRSRIVTNVKSPGSTAATSSHRGGADARASGTGRIEYADAIVRSNAFCP